MSEASRRLKVNKRLAERTCSRCNAALAFGQDAVACLRCEQVYHAACWDEAGGCASAGCENAAIPRLDPQTTVHKEVPPGRQECPHCGRQFRAGAKICPSCKRAPTADGIYHGPTTNAPGAVASLVYGILSIFICGLIFGLLAINKAGEAQKAIARDPTLGGTGLATAGKVIGIIGLVLWGLIVLVRIAGVGQR
jgi:hypothetical protein